MDDEDITSLSVGSVESIESANPWSNGEWSCETIPIDKSTSNDMDIQQQVYELVSKNYTLEYKNKELTDKLNSLESELLELMCKVEDLKEIIVKICEDYILSDDD